MNDIGKKVKILWHDAIILYPKRKGDTPVFKKEDILPSVMETTGILEQNWENYVLIAGQNTINKRTGNKHPEQNPTFYLIPKGMIDSMEYC